MCVYIATKNNVCNQQKKRIEEMLNTTTSGSSDVCQVQSDCPRECGSQLGCHWSEVKNFIHYSDREIKSFIPLKSQRSFGPKPRGLFISRGEAWINWCKREGFFPHNYKYKYQVIIPSTTKLLVIDKTNVDSLMEKYLPTEKSTFCDWLDWSLIAKEYDGIWVVESLLSIPYDKNNFKYLAIHTYDVETVVLWNGEPILQPLPMDEHDDESNESNESNENGFVELN